MSLTIFRFIGLLEFVICEECGRMLDYIEGEGWAVIHASSHKRHKDVCSGDETLISSFGREFRGLETGPKMP